MQPGRHLLSPDRFGALVPTVCAALLTALLLSGCSSPASPFLLPDENGGVRQVDSEGWQAARSTFDSAGDATSLKRAIEMLETLLSESAFEAPVLTALAEAHTLYGAAYADDRKVKSEHFQRARLLALSALATNPEFQTLISAGDTPGQASNALSPDDVPAMVIWVTATSYLFREGFSLWQRLRHFRQMGDVRTMMERALVLDPDYEAGVVPFSLAIYFIAAPGIAGGDLDTAQGLLDQAENTPGVSLLPSWGRAKYYYPARGRPEAARELLEWILAQNPAGLDSPYRWNVYIQDDARRMLGNLQ
jgi:hypothetical protein